MSGAVTGGGRAIIPGSMLPGLIVSGRGSVPTIDPFSWSVAPWFGMRGYRILAGGAAGGAARSPLAYPRDRVISSVILSGARRAAGGGCLPFEVGGLEILQATSPGARENTTG
jgi:hypothetical protein